MIPGTFNLDLYRGDTGRWRVQLWTDPEKVIAVDLTDVDVTAMVRDKATGGKYCQQLDCTVTLPNIVDMLLPATLASTLPAKGVWDLQLTYPGGDVATMLRGNVTVTQDVTYPDMTRSSLRLILR